VVYDQLLLGCWVLVMEAVRLALLEGMVGVKVLAVAVVVVVVVVVGLDHWGHHAQVIP